MKLRNILNQILNEQLFSEALNPSEFRNLMKIGRQLASSRIDQIWPKIKSYSDFTNRSQDRLYFKLDSSSDISIPSKQEIENYTSDNNYVVIDFSKGLVKKKGDKNVIKLGKVLTMLGKEDDAALKLLQKYNNEKSLETSYDVGGMSTYRNWTSCMNLRGGGNERYVAVDIEKGTLISYLIKESDKNIKNPLARILIKPYINSIDADDVLYGIEHDSVKYGLKNENYVKKLISVLDKSQGEKSGVFKFDDDLYSDSGKSTIIRKIPTEKLKELKQKFESRVKELRDGLTFEIVFDKFYWLLDEDVSFENAVLGFDNQLNIIKWYNGTWKGGRWRDGTWELGTWEHGIWLNGTWASGTWKGGTWQRGVWENGTWENGTWKDGIWRGGDWVDGTWEGGVWKSNSPHPNER